MAGSWRTSPSGKPPTLGPAPGQCAAATTWPAARSQLIPPAHGRLPHSIDRWLVPPKPKCPPTSLLGKLSALRPYQLSRPYLKNNYVHLVFGLVLLIVNLGLFVSRAIEYRHHNGFVILARACGRPLCLSLSASSLRTCS